MRKAIIAGLTLCAAMGAGHALTRSQRSRLILHKGIRSRGQNLPDLVSFQLNFLIPAHPLVYDRAHVSFPQYSRGLDGLNDGSFRWRW